MTLSPEKNLFLDLVRIDHELVEVFVPIERRAAWEEIKARAPVSPFCWRPPMCLEAKPHMQLPPWVWVSREGELVECRWHPTRALQRAVRDIAEDRLREGNLDKAASEAFSRLVQCEFATCDGCFSCWSQQ